MQEKDNEIVIIKEIIYQGWTIKKGERKIPKSTILINNTYQ